MNSVGCPSFLFGSYKSGDKIDNNVNRADESQTCGGTAHILPNERKNQTFDTLKLTTFLDGDKKKTARRRWIWNEGQMHDNSRLIYLTREELIAEHAKRFIELHQSYMDEGFIPKPGDIMLMSQVSKSGAFGLHFGAFLPTLLSQADQEQQAEWLFPAFQMKIIGSLSQTELGHGSNVRGLQTTATYDKDTEEFIINTPTLKSLKWWPGGLGCSSTHTCIYAQLIIDGKEYGFHVFVLQLRDENHQPLPGIELGEVGPKIGDNMTETGFLRVSSVRIPRRWMLMKNQVVTKEGEYKKKVKKGSSASKIQYSTMLSIRCALVIGAGYNLAKGATIATRYSLVRQQGFKSSTADNRLSEENQILNYQVQQYRIFTQIAKSYAFIFTGRYLDKIFDKIKKQFAAAPEDVDLTDLPELHASSSGLKALCTYEVADGLEDLRLCCGAHGVLEMSGLAPLVRNKKTYNTAEGDKIILELQLARFLLKQYRQALEGTKPSGSCDYLNIFLNNKNNDPYELLNSNYDFSGLSDFSNLDDVLDLFKYRTIYSIINVHQRIQSIQQNNPQKDYNTVWNECAIDLVHCSRYHCYYIILRSFYYYLLESKDTLDVDVFNVLMKLCSLYAYSHLQESVGNWIDILTSKHVSIIKSNVRSLLSDIRIDAIGLVDAFEFPDNCLNSAIGQYSGNCYESLYNGAKASSLNKKTVFDGYQYLSKTIDKEFVAEHAKMVRCDNNSPSNYSFIKSNL
eukprot:TRINITY_DN10618_c0_g1_i1.p1 TRINITY_DN10618_c0_g1~~TRINITY_DN10618_c0_g1_i1.p1  ORF type:complete len:738 (+),score=241.42 TRINITY_DN10618_c0_g1_i1:40-2253(+)